MSQEFVDAIRRRPARCRPRAPGSAIVATWTCALIANQEKTLDAVKLAQALEGFKLPPEVALMPNEPFYRAEDHQLMPSLFVGHAIAKGDADPEDLFDVDQVVKGTDVAPTAERDRLQADLAGLSIAALPGVALERGARGRTPRAETAG